MVIIVGGIASSVILYGIHGITVDWKDITEYKGGVNFLLSTLLQCRSKQNIDSVCRTLYGTAQITACCCLNFHNLQNVVIDIIYKTNYFPFSQDLRKMKKSFFLPPLPLFILNLKLVPWVHI